MDSRFRKNRYYDDDFGYESRKQRLDSVSRKKILRQVYEEEIMEEDDYDYEDDYEDYYPRK